MDVGQDSTSCDSHTFQQLKKHKSYTWSSYCVHSKERNKRRKDFLRCGIFQLQSLLTHCYFQFTQMRPVYNGAPTCVTADLVQLLVVGDGQKDVSWRNATLLVISGSITCQLQDLSCNSRKNKHTCPSLFLTVLQVTSPPGTVASSV